MSNCLRRAVRDGRLTHRTIRVYAYLFGELDLVQPRTIKLEAVAKALRMHRGDVSREVSLLIDKGYLSLKENDGTRRTFLIPLSCPLSEPATSRSA